MSRKLSLSRPLIVEVEWVDSATTGGWQGNPRASLLMVRTAGYLTQRTRKCVAVTQSNAQNGDWGDTTVIPRSNVKKITVLGRSRLHRED